MYKILGANVQNTRCQCTKY